MKYCQDVPKAIESQPMQALLLSSEEVAKRAYQLYESGISHALVTNVAASFGDVMERVSSNFRYGD